MASEGFSPKTVLRKACFTCKRLQYDRSREGRICYKCRNNFHNVCFEKTPTGQIQCSNCMKADESPSRNLVDQIVYYLATDLAHPRDLDIWNYHITSDKKRELIILKWMVFYNIHRIGKDVNLVNRLQILKSRLGVFSLDPEREEYQLFSGKVASYVASMAIKFKKLDIIRENGDGTVKYHPKTQAWLSKDWNGDWIQQRNAWPWANPPTTPQQARKREHEGDPSRTLRGKRTRISSVSTSLFEDRAESDPSEAIVANDQQEDIRAQQYQIAESDEGKIKPLRFNAEDDDTTAYIYSMEELDGVRHQITERSNGLATRLQNARACVGSYRTLESLDPRLLDDQSQYYATFDAVYRQLYGHGRTATLSATIAKDFREIKELRDREKLLEERHEEIVARTRVKMRLDIQCIESLLEEIPPLSPVAQIFQTESI